MAGRTGRARTRPIPADPNPSPGLRPAADPRQPDRPAMPLFRLRPTADQAVLHLPGPPPVEVALVRSARARRLSLRVGRHDGRVRLTLPLRVGRAEAAAFLAAHEGWLRGVLSALPAGELVGPGTALPVEGRRLILTPAPLRAARIEGERLLLPGPAAQAGARAAAFLRALARDRLSAAADRHAAALGRKVSVLALRDTRSRWGSCSAGGRLMFNWRLVMAPPAVLDYVAAHEAAHLVHMDHSAAFWSLVARLCPDHAAQRRWLRGEGTALHAFRFGPEPAPGGARAGAD